MSGLTLRPSLVSFARIGHVLSSKSLPTIVGVVALLIALPTIQRGLEWDDLNQRTMVMCARDSAVANGNPWLPRQVQPTFFSTIGRLFIFGHPDINDQLEDAGLLPWWSLGQLRIAHFRPLSAITHWLDLTIFGDWALPMHAENVLLYAAACILVAVFYRQLAGATWIAGLAAIMFALDDAHIIPVGWIANRNGLLALIFGLLCILAHDRWRRDQWRVGAFLAPGYLLLAVFSGELGVATGAYILSHVLFLERGPWQKRLKLLTPYLFIGILWIFFYQYFDYGSYGSDLYVDPGRETVRFLKSIIEQGPILLIGQIAAIDPLPYYLVSAPMRMLYWFGDLVSLVGVAFVLYPLVRGNNLSRFFCCGMLLSLVLVSGVHVTTGRVLLFVGVGAMGLVAQFIELMRGKGAGYLKSPLRQLCARVVFWVFVIVHLVVSPLHFVYRTTAKTPMVMDLDVLLNVGPLPDVDKKDLIVVNAPNTFCFIYFSSLRMLRHQPLPAHTRILAPGSTSVVVAREDSNTIVVKPFGGYLTPPGSTIGSGEPPIVHPAYYFQHLDKTVRGSAYPMTRGEHVSVTGMEVEVIEISKDGRPLEARIRFAAPLEASSLKWLQWDWQQQAFVAFTLPRIGESVYVAGPPPGLSTGLDPITGL